ncbi:hypothetical protein A8E81_31640 [Burkholderia cenocepacia]|nr:hypothetical protein A8E75_16640 [Burkholderia cenocepacia]ONV24878.1 hypothetical protein A8E78_28080 [Burkholderia cenocepacia]ONV29500.1 hypothetical protein A8E77_22625 [Burkholderia cenocepacia]ONV36504.1 hypothetical protein A8E82_29115 [Burkholderia cenocepacia]ONV44158.1 hypothetical protein A8E81_31640 [Burkholderia cenocepacia]
MDGPACSRCRDKCVRQGTVRIYRLPRPPDMRNPSSGTSNISNACPRRPSYGATHKPPEKRILAPIARATRAAAG